MTALLLCLGGALHAERVTGAGVVAVHLSESGVTSDSSLVREEGREVTIAGAGTFRLSGRWHGGRIVVDSAAPGVVTLELAGVSVYAAAGPALLVEAAEEVVLRLADGSFNTLIGGEPLADEPDAALFSGPDLRLEGKGHLLVMARSQHGIVGERDLQVQGGVITVIAADDGLRAANLTVSGGDLLVFAANDALKSTGDEEGSGRVLLAGGSLDLVAAGDGVQAERVLRVSGGTISVVSGGGRSVEPGEASAKGLKAGRELLVEGGTVLADSSDDALHSDGRLLLAGGDLTLATADDAVHADESVHVSGGHLEVLGSREGLEAPHVAISGGSVLVNASDDALNAAGDAPTGELLASISGGHVVLNAGSDAIDSNGSVSVTGGTLVLNGPTTFSKPAIDRHEQRSVLLAGGTIVAVGPLAFGRGSAIDRASTQAVLFLEFDRRVEGGTVVSIRTDDVVVATFRAPRALVRMSFTSPALVAGEKYEVWLGGVPLGRELPGGVFEPPGVTGGNLWRRVPAL